MRLAGFQPLSLIDYPGVIACIVFTQGCPWRCIYCHNPELLPTTNADHSDALTEERLFDHLQKHRRMLEGVCVTGGEPTIHPDLPRFLTRLKDTGLLIKLDTNGIHPRMIEKILAARLVDYVAMDFKHTWERYADVIGLQQPHVIEACRTTYNLIASSQISHEFRTTVYPAVHSAHDLHTIASELPPGTRYALQYMRYDKTLVPNLARVPPLNLEQIGQDILVGRPDLHIDIRNNSY